MESDEKAEKAEKANPENATTHSASGRGVRRPAIEGDFVPATWRLLATEAFWRVCRAAAYACESRCRASSLVPSARTHVPVPNLPCAEATSPQAPGTASIPASRNASAETVTKSINVNVKPAYLAATN